ARPWQLGRAFEILREALPTATPVIFGRAVGRTGESIVIVPLDAADAQFADMATCIIVGSTETRLISRDGRAPLVYAPRSLAKATT
ncbi:MAG: precorrin-3B C(17)-methyltransferase, partial [Stellaceae bacterium]